MDCLLVLDKAEIPEEIDGFPARVVRVSSAVMNKLSGLQSTESTEAIGLLRFPTSFFNLVDRQEAAGCERWFPVAHRILVLDGIQVIVTPLIHHFWFCFNLSISYVEKRHHLLWSFSV